jgi:uncharacterized protein (DUF697 family)
LSNFDKLKEKVMRDIDASVKSNIDLKEKINKVILVSSGISAGAAVQPLPFADFPILTTIEAIMVLKIGELYGFKLSFDRGKEILLEIGGVIGMGWLAKNLIITGYKTFIPFAGGFFTIPLVFGSCYAIGKVTDYYFKCKQEGSSFDKKIADSIFKAAKKDGEKLGKQKENIRHTKQE